MFFSKRIISKLGLVFLILLLTINLMQTFHNTTKIATNRAKKDKILKSASSSNQNRPNNESQFIFIGGYARSGTTLMRAIFDVHPHIKCGPETKIIPSFLNYAIEFGKVNPSLEKDLANAGLELSIIDSAMTDFIANIMRNRGFNASRLCAKDPDVLQYMDYLYNIFPKAKFIFMVRDGRAAAYSLSQQYKERTDFFRFREHLLSWMFFNKKVSEKCEQVGANICLIVKYEDLVLIPEATLKKVMNFLGEKWSIELLNHHNHIGKEVSVSKTEWSTHQIIKPINSESVDFWKTKMNYTDSQIFFIEPMLTYFNYSITKTSSYQTESIVRKNNKLLNKNREKYDKLGRELSEHYSNLHFIKQ